jgi:hypothetical protein
MFDRLCGALIFTKLDLWNAYHLIRIVKGDEYKTGFPTLYGQFKCEVMLFGWRNAPATFQASIDDCLQPVIDNFAVCYLDDILTYLTNKEEHEEQVRKVLQW